jgi:hypothetical protein
MQRSIHKYSREIYYIFFLFLFHFLCILKVYTYFCNFFKPGGKLKKRKENVEQCMGWIWPMALRRGTAHGHNSSWLAHVARRVRARVVRSLRSRWLQWCGHQRLAGGRDMDMFFRRGRVECGEHTGHGGVAEGSPGKWVTSEALRWWRSSGIPTMAAAPLAGGNPYDLIRYRGVS